MKTYKQPFTLLLVVTLFLFSCKKTQVPKGYVYTGWYPVSANGSHSFLIKSDEVLFGEPVKMLRAVR